MTKPTSPWDIKAPSSIADKRPFRKPSLQPAHYVTYAKAHAARPVTVEDEGCYFMQEGDKAREAAE